MQASPRRIALAVAFTLLIALALTVPTCPLWAQTLTVQIIQPDCDPLLCQPGVEQPFEAVAYLDGAELDDGTLTWDWDFGDATDHSTTNPTAHTYADAGNYTVTVTATYGTASGSAQLGVDADPDAAGTGAKLEFPAAIGGKVCDETLLRVSIPNFTGGFIITSTWWKAEDENDWHKCPDNPADAPPLILGWYLTDNNQAYEAIWVTWGAKSKVPWKWRVQVCIPRPGQSIYMWTNTCEETARNTVVTSGSDVILHHVGDTSHTISWNLDHRPDCAEGWDVTVEIHSLGGGVVRTLTKHETSIGQDQLDWDGSQDAPLVGAAPAGVYSYLVKAAHTNCPLCNDQDKSRTLTATINDNKFYWSNKDLENHSLTAVVRYTLSEAASDCTIRFFGVDMTTPLAELAGQAAQGAHWSTPVDISGIVDLDGSIIQPLYCVIWATESDARAAQNRGQDHKQALQVGTTNMAQLIDLHATDLFGDVPETRVDPDGVEDDEDDPGAFVHFNIDDDAGVHTSIDGYDPATAGDYTLDGPIPGEDDLRPVAIALSAPAEANGCVYLRRSDPKIKVWTNAEKGPANQMSLDGDKPTWDLSVDRTAFDNMKNSLWVEGCGDGSAYLTVTYTTPGPDYTPLATDTVKYTFIAALRGRQPGQKRRRAIRGKYPGLVDCEWSITGEKDPWYNCIAYSVGDTTWGYKIWWDEVKDGVRNHKGIDQHFGVPAPDGNFDMADLDNFYLLKKGYTPVALGPTDAEVMYYQNFHAAKHLHCSDGAGQWIMYESKLGADELIEHVWNQLNGSAYGSPVRYYK
jgi:PKD repeat protein